MIESFITKRFVEPLKNGTPDRNVIDHHVVDCFHGLTNLAQVGANSVYADLSSFRL